MAPRTWTCQRVTAGEKCGHVNPRIRKLCEECGKRRPAAVGKRTKAQAPEEAYEAFIERQGGEYCVIGRALGQPCGDGPQPSGRRLARDHDHATGAPRGLLCFRHNLQLKAGFDARTLRVMADYIEQYSTSPIGTAATEEDR